MILAGEEGEFGGPTVGPGGVAASLAALAEDYLVIITTAAEDYDSCIDHQIRDLAWEKEALAAPCLSPALVSCPPQGQPS